MGDDITIPMGGAAEKYAEYWVKPDGYFYRDENDYPNAINVPDLSIWATHLVLNKKAHQLLSNRLDTYGEILPVNCEGNTCFILNIFAFAEDMGALDGKKSKYDEMDGCRTDLGKIVFREKQLNDTLLFKTRFDGFNRIYCTDKFRLLVEEAGLNGLLFKTDLEGFM